MPPRSTLIAPPRGRRIMRPRRRGSRLPEGAVYVGRPTLWGNPFMVGRWGHARSVILHENWLAGRLGALSLENMGWNAGEIEALERRRRRVLTSLHTLAGRDLACWCPLTSQWCHAETLLSLAPTHWELERLAA